MKKFLVFLAAISLVFGVVGTASAITFTDSTLFYSDHTDPNVDLNSWGGQYVNELEYMTDWVSWTHHFDFDPAAAEILSGSLTLTLRDDQVTWRRWTFDDLLPEFGIGWGEDFTWDFGEVDTGNYTYSVNASYLADGDYTVTVASAFGDFYIDQSDLEITYNPVPEPATMLLLGSGLIGLAGLGRKKFFKKNRKEARS